MIDKKLERFWRYLLAGKQYPHLSAWYSEILKTQGYDAAELFKKRVNEVNKYEMLK